MIKRLLNFIQKDMVSALRNNITLYLIFFPIISAGVIAVLLPSFESGSASFAINMNTVEQNVIDEFDKFGFIETYETDKEIENRVEAVDDVIGLTKKGNVYQVILEGNETGETVVYNDIGEIVDGAVPMLMNYVLAEEHVAEFKYESLDSGNSYMKEFMLCILILSAIQMAAMAIAFNIVEENEQKSIHALAVSPLNMFEYVVARGILILIISVLLNLVNVFILMGTGTNYLMLLLGILCSNLVGILLAFIIGGFATNQITAIAIMKVAFMTFLAIPIGGFFVPEAWRSLFYIFPNYWMFNIFTNLFIEPQPVGYWWSLLLTVGTSLVYLMVLVPIIGKRLKLR
jgi:ABC-2 type transport system permease protein